MRTMAEFIGSLTCSKAREKNTHTLSVYCLRLDQWVSAKLCMNCETREREEFVRVWKQ